MSQGTPTIGPNSPKEGTLVRGLAFVAALGGLLFGYDTAVISGAVGAIDANFITPRGLSETSADSLSGWAISCALLGCVIGAALAGPMSQKIGRKGGLLVSAVLFILSSAGSAYPEFGFLWIGGEGPEALTAFILYRILGGVGIGVASMLSPLYIAEIAPPSQRGQLVTYQQVAIVVGMTMVYFVNWFIASQGDDQWVLSTGWRYMLISAALPAALFFGLLLLVPETPRWLVMKGRMDAACCRASRTMLKPASCSKRSTNRCANAAAHCSRSVHWSCLSASRCRYFSSSSASMPCCTMRR
jgi:MFS transporter, SP family, xylose:H+ symportor